MSITKTLYAPFTASASVFVHHAGKKGEPRAELELELRQQRGLLSHCAGIPSHLASLARRMSIPYRVASNDEMQSLPLQRKRPAPSVQCISGD